MSKPIARMNGEFPAVSRLALSAIAAAAVTTQAVEFENDVVEGSLDTTLSYGASFRTSAAEPGNIGIANGGTRYSVNGDDANLNYGTGLFSHVAKGTHDLEIDFKKLQDVSLFLRGTYFVDFENIRGDSPLSEAAQREVGRDMELLDAYISYDLPTSIPVNIRLGNQVLSWGESTFIQNGINVINPIDVKKFRVPGSELREALMPVPMLSFSVQATDNLTLEGFYQFKQVEMEIDPPGSYFSSNDFVGPGGRYAMLGFGTFKEGMQGYNIPVPGVGPVPADVFFNPSLNPRMRYSDVELGPESIGSIPRGKKREASDSGQFGLAARYFAEELNDTEFGFYFINYHSRLPLISARTGEVPNPKIDTTGNKVPDTHIKDVLEAAGLGEHAYLDPTQNPFALLYPGTARYIIEYPEDIQLYGVSFNAEIGATGISLQGEVSYREDVPLQVDDVELLLAGLTPSNPALANLTQLGAYGPNTSIPGFRKEQVWQPQFTVTKLFGPTLGASQWVLVGEAAATVVPGLPSKDKLRFDGPGTALSGNWMAPIALGRVGHATDRLRLNEDGKLWAKSELDLNVNEITGQIIAGNQDEVKIMTPKGPVPVSVLHLSEPPIKQARYEPASAFADDFSWGYRLAARIDYMDVIGGVNLSPAIVFAHDVDGNTPLPLGNFLHDRKSVTVGVTATYQNSWQGTVKYTEFFGNEDYNLMHDRDFLQAMVQYSF